MGALVIEEKNITEARTYGHVGGGECVELVKQLLMKQYGVPAAAVIADKWRPGIKVMENLGKIERGTCIATFDPRWNNFSGRYPNFKHGNHAGIFLSISPGGFTILDQYKKHEIAKNIGKDVDTVKRDYLTYFKSSGIFPEEGDLTWPWDQDKKKDTEWIAQGHKRILRAPTNDADWYFVIMIAGINA